ncbi:Uu.00g064470.m01.CDS01 [Anthostomella pinea]|uniref:Uu.00g064470.m01.CDS01 n=1 Tax=Anthostomella pinea TaxID=933095 RepID=A0AAI8VTJ1_9PEZI|nr:Uu.00g064470.m01.CDS01 [Anthostomella pinea]
MARVLPLWLLYAIAGGVGSVNAATGAPKPTTYASVTDTLTIPWVGTSTYTIAPGDEVTVPLPEGHLTTLSAQGPPILTTAVPLPEGHLTTFTLGEGEATTVSLSGIGLTTISFSWTQGTETQTAAPEASGADSTVLVVSPGTLPTVSPSDVVVPTISSSSVEIIPTFTPVPISPPPATISISSGSGVPPAGTDSPSSRTVLPPVASGTPLGHVLPPPIGTDLPSSSTVLPPVVSGTPSGHVLPPPIGTDSPSSSTLLPPVISSTPSGTLTILPVPMPSQTILPPPDTVHISSQSLLPITPGPHGMPIPSKPCTASDGSSLVACPTILPPPDTVHISSQSLLPITEATHGIPTPHPITSTAPDGSLTTFLSHLPTVSGIPIPSWSTYTSTASDGSIQTRYSSLSYTPISLATPGISYSTASDGSSIIVVTVAWSTASSSAGNTSVSRLWHNTTTTPLPTEHSTRTHHSSNIGSIYTTPSWWNTSALTVRPISPPPVGDGLLPPHSTRPYTPDTTSSSTGTVSWPGINNGTEVPYTTTASSSAGTTNTPSGKNTIMPPPTTASSSAGTTSTPSGNSTVIPPPTTASSSAVTTSAPSGNGTIIPPPNTGSSSPGTILPPPVTILPPPGTQSPSGTIIPPPDTTSPPNGTVFPPPGTVTSTPSAGNSTIIPIVIGGGGGGSVVAPPPPTDGGGPPPPPPVTVGPPPPPVTGGSNPTSNIPPPGGIQPTGGGGGGGSHPTSDTPPPNHTDPTGGGSNGSNTVPTPTGTGTLTPTGTDTVIPTATGSVPSSSVTCELDSPSGPSSTSTPTSAVPTSTPCPGLMSFARQMVSINGDDYYIPLSGDPQHLMLNDDLGTEVTISPSRVEIGGSVFCVPATPLPTPSIIPSQDGHNISFHARPLPSPALQPPSGAGRDYAVKVANGYIGFSNSMTDPVGSMFMALFDFYARYDAPSDSEATKLLGSEDQAFDDLLDAARVVAGNFSSAPQEDWEGFMNQISLLDAPKKQPDKQPTAQQYIDEAFSGLQGINNFCQRVSWRTEGLLNIARFLARDSWVSRPQLIAHLKNSRQDYMATQPGGEADLHNGGGEVVSGAAGFYLVFQVQLPKNIDLFGDRGWYIGMEQELPDWYFTSITNFLDKSAGPAMGSGSWPSTGQAYTLRMDVAQASPLMLAYMNQNDLVATVTRHMNQQESEDYIATYWANDIENEETAGDQGGASIPQKSNRSNLGKRVPTEDPLPPAYEHQRLISAESTKNRPIVDQPYRRDDSGGEGITVFFMDSGFDMHPVYETEMGVSQWIFEPDRYSFYNTPEDMLPDVAVSDRIEDSLNDNAPNGNGVRAGHGTAVAPLAVGRTYGLAPKADPYLIELVDAYYGPDRKVRQAAGQTPALKKSFEKIIEIIVSRNLQGKAVVSSAFLKAQEFAPDWQNVKDLYARNIARLEELGVLWVQAAGNHGLYPNNPTKPWRDLSQFLPTSLASDDNNILTVGSTDGLGRYTTWTSPVGIGSGPAFGPGKINVWAMGDGVKLMGLAGARDRAQFGTSFAAPQVAGLAAYFLGLEKDMFRWNPNGGADQGKTLCLSLKRHIEDFAYRRIPMDRQLALPGGVSLPYPMPDDINVAYNGIYGQQDSCGVPGVPSKRADQGNPDDPGYMCPVAVPVGGQGGVPGSTSMPSTFVTSTIAPTSGTGGADAMFTATTTVASCIPKAGATGGPNGTQVARGIDCM